MSPSHRTGLGNKNRSSFLEARPRTLSRGIPTRRVHSTGRAIGAGTESSINLGSVNLALPAAVLRSDLSPKAAPLLFFFRCLFGLSFLAQFFANGLQSAGDIRHPMSNRIDHFASVPNGCRVRLATFVVVCDVKADAADRQQHSSPPGDPPSSDQHERRHEQHKPKHPAFLHVSRSKESQLR